MIDKNKFPSAVLKALEILNTNNSKAYIVGGSVRDIIMGISPKDFDITTSSSPQENLKIFSGYKTFETGIRFGTITVIIDNTPIEITTFRTDGEYKDNRKPENVVFSKTIDSDLSRRDFTINAMAYSPYDGFVDLFEGKADIEKNIIRAIGNPDERFREDALRILRALRFSSRLGFEIEDATKKAIFRNKNLLKNISAERIREEFNKIILGENAVNVLSDFRDVIAEFIPETARSFGFDQKSKYHIYDVYTHTLKALEAVPFELSTRLAVFFHDIAKPFCFTTDTKGFRHYKEHQEMGAEIAKKILKRLKYDNRTIKEVATLIKYHDTIITPHRTSVKKFLALLGEDLLSKLFVVKFCDCHGKPNMGGIRYQDAVKANEIMKDIVLKNECYCLATLKIDGNDLLEKDIPNEHIGTILKHVLNEVIEENLTNEKSALLEYALEYYKNNLH